MIRVGGWQCNQVRLCVYCATGLVISKIGRCCCGRVDKSFVSPNNSGAKSDMYKGTSRASNMSFLHSLNPYNSGNVHEHYWQATTGKYKHQARHAANRASCWLSSLRLRSTTPYGCRVRQLHTPDNSNVRLSSSTTLYARQLQRTVVEFDNSMRLKPCACCISDACCKAISSACVLPAQGCRYPEYPEQGLLYPVQLVLPC